MQYTFLKCSTRVHKKLAKFTMNDTESVLSCPWPWTVDIISGNPLIIKWVYRFELVTKKLGEIKNRGDIQFLNFEN